MITRNLCWENLTSKEKMNEELKEASTLAEKLLVAATYGNVTLAKKLINSGVPVNPNPSQYTTTPLYIAAVTGQVAMVEFLISQGANINQPSPARLHITPLVGSVAGRSLEVFNTLIHYGADVHLVYRSYMNETILHNVIFLAQYRFEAALAMIKKLLELNVNIDVKNIFNETPLEKARSNIRAWTILHGEETALRNFSIIEGLFMEHTKTLNNDSKQVVVTQKDQPSMVAILLKNSTVLKNSPPELKNEPSPSQPEDDFVLISKEHEKKSTEHHDVDGFVFVPNNTQTESKEFNDRSKPCVMM